MPAAERQFSYRETFPRIPESDAYPSGTFALATGVGKTRLMAAIIAYFATARESSNFLILAPRRAILRQILEGLDTSSPKYLFASEALVKPPRVWHSGNVDRFGLPSAELDLGLGPTIYLFSPQSFTGGDRRAARVSSDFADMSVLEALEAAEDLVVLVDEAHHLPGGAARERRAWSDLVDDIQPMARFGFTATPSEAERPRVLSEYSLATCLREGLYTKSVRVLTETRPASALVTDTEWDRRTLDFALKRRDAKEAAVHAARDGGLEFPLVHPVLLVAATDTAHADEVAKWLVEDRGLKPESVHVTHSLRAKTEEEIERLQSIEKAHSPIRVVVNVQELSEGWDVTNVYVICPLRSLSTFTNAIQTIGRGLRLPAGRRVGDDELDGLDVFCFGRERLGDILDSATNKFGDPDDQDLPITIDPPPINEELIDFPVALRQQACVTLPSATLSPPAWNLEDLSFDASAIRSGSVVGIKIARQEVMAVEGQLTLALDVFAQRVAAMVVQKLPFLSASTDGPKLRALVYRIAEPVVMDGRVPLEPLYVVEYMAEGIRDHFMRLPRSYTALAKDRTLCFDAYTAHVRGEHSLVIPPGKWVKEQHRRRPMGPWRKGVHSAVVLDSGPELAVARVLDRSAAVEWWARNDPAVVRIRTPAGNYWPDFVAKAKIAGVDTTVLIGVKGEHLWDSSEVSEARIKAIHASRFCEAATRVGTRRFEHWLVLGGDAEAAGTFEQLRDSTVRLGSYLVRFDLTDAG